MTAAVAALLIATAPLAYAQQIGTASHDPTVAAPNLDGIIQPDQIRASKIIGRSVYDVQNRDIGKVTDVILNRDGRVVAVVDPERRRGGALFFRGPRPGVPDAISSEEGHLRRGHRSVGDGVRGCAFRDVIFQLEDAGGAAHKFVDLSCHA